MHHNWSLAIEAPLAADTQASLQTLSNELLGETYCCRKILILEFKDQKYYKSNKKAEAADPAVILRMMQGVLPPLEVEDRIVMHKDPQQARHCFDKLVAANPDLRIELQGDGKIIVMAPAGGESDFQSSEIVIQLGSWAKADGRGKVFGASLGCNLPDGSTLSPDAAWIPNEMLNALPKAARRTYLPLVPPFIVEVKSPSDSKKELQEKCRQWIANGAQLVWFINGDNRTVWEYFDSTEQEIKNAEAIKGKGPVQGFILDLRPIWEGL